MGNRTIARRARPSVCVGISSESLREKEWWRWIGVSFASACPVQFTCRLKGRVRVCERNGLAGSTRSNPRALAATRAAIALALKHYWRPSWNGTRERASVVPSSSQQRALLSGFYAPTTERHCVVISSAEMITARCCPCCWDKACLLGRGSRRW